jgi:hypothetical protein
MKLKRLAQSSNENEALSAVTRLEKLLHQTDVPYADVMNSTTYTEQWQRDIFDMIIEFESTPDTIKNIKKVIDMCMIDNYYYQWGYINGIADALEYWYEDTQPERVFALRLKTEPEEGYDEYQRKYLNEMTDDDGDIYVDGRVDGFEFFQKAWGIKF